MNDKEVDELINFAKSLDYNKYLKNMEIREALYLIKNKVETEGVNNDFGVENNNNQQYNQNNNEVQNNNYMNNNDNNSVNEREKKQIAIENSINEKNNQAKVVIHDSDWDTNTVI